MRSGIKLYSNIKTHKTILELWGASTKHPDSRFDYTDFQKVDFIDDEWQIFQWLLECASKLNFPFFAKDLTDFAIMYYNEIHNYYSRERG
jgi:hypothetical protein